MSKTNAAHGLDILGGLSAECFFQEYWQKKPLLIRQALPGFDCPVTEDELAGLSLEDDVESRIIIENGAQAPWELQSGPFDNTDFESLPDSHWTLLIQQLDAWVPEINALKQHFSFIPNWRIDDIMASYAPVGGSVGPHFDYYDVFLLQAKGQRKWQIGQACDRHSPTLPNTSLSILQHFNMTGEWTLEAGDMLYLPPKLAHHGVALNDCITLSIGFRAPTHQQLLDDFTQSLLAEDLGSCFYEDPDIEAQASCGEISASAIRAIDAILDKPFNDLARRREWLVKYLSEPKNPSALGEDHSGFTMQDLQDLILQGHDLNQNEGSRFVYVQHDSQVILGVDGSSYRFGIEQLPAIDILCNSLRFKPASMLRTDDNDAIFSLLLRLIREGSLYF